MNRIHLRGQVRELVGADVAQLLGPRLYSSITANDQHPFFIEMIVAHEGTSRGEIAGLGARVKEWGKRVIRALVSAFDPSGRWPAKLYDGIENWHGNEAARVAVGEVVHSRVAELGGVTGAQAIGYIFPAQAALRESIRRGERDCCSMEADVVAVADASGRIVIEDVERASAIVLGHTSRQMPGFDMARVRSISEFCPPDDPPAPPAPTPPEPPAPAPALPAPAPAPQPAPVEPSREQILDMARKAGITAADLQPPAPAQAAIPAPPEPAQPAAATTGVDLTSPKFNEFLPSD